jgi:predicted AAA+ superfamily ATPase
VTGSARLDLYRRGGDSLQGRNRYLRLYPFSFKELNAGSDSTVFELLEFSGFPQSFLSKSAKDARVWSC